MANDDTADDTVQHAYSPAPLYLQVVTIVIVCMVLVKSSVSNKQQLRTGPPMSEGGGGDGVMVQVPNPHLQCPPDANWELDEIVASDNDIKRDRYSERGDGNVDVLCGEEMRVWDIVPTVQHQSIMRIIAVELGVFPGAKVLDWGAGQ